ncbi:MAG: hypothetical protein ABIL44_00970 [candidate division WOR-3 bacterium]
MSKKIKIGIINCETGKIVKEKILEDNSIWKDEKEEFQKKALKEVKKMSAWFDDKDTFFSGKKIWDCWERIGDNKRFESVIKGTGWSKISTLSVAVFNGNHGEEYELYVEEIE